MSFFCPRDKLTNMKQSIKIITKIFFIIPPLFYNV